MDQIKSPSPYFLVRNNSLQIQIRRKKKIFLNGEEVCIVWIAPAMVSGPLVQQRCWEVTEKVSWEWTSYSVLKHWDWRDATKLESVHLQRTKRIFRRVITTLKKGKFLRPTVVVQGRLRYGFSQSHLPMSVSVCRHAIFSGWHIIMH